MPVKALNRFTAEANRLVNQLTIFINQLTVVQTYLHEAGEDRDYNKVSFVTGQLLLFEKHIQDLIRDQDKHELGHLWTEVNRTRNQLVYQMEDIHQLFIKYAYLHLQDERNKAPTKENT